MPFHPLTVATMIEDLAATYAVGEDPFQIERLFRHAYYGEGYESKIVHQHPRPFRAGYHQRLRNGLLGHSRQSNEPTHLQSNGR